MAHKTLYILIRGPGRSEVDFPFLLFLTTNFFRDKKILFLAKVIKFSNGENTYNYIVIVHSNLNRDSPKNQL